MSMWPATLRVNWWNQTKNQTFTKGVVKRNEDEEARQLRNKQNGDGRIRTLRNFATSVMWVKNCGKNDQNWSGKRFVWAVKKEQRTQEERQRTTDHFKLHE